MCRHETSVERQTAGLIPMVGAESLVLKGDCSWNAAVGFGVKRNRVNNTEIWSGQDDQPDSMSFTSSKINVGPLNSDGSRTMSFYSYRPIHINHQEERKIGRIVPVEVYRTDIIVDWRWQMQRSTAEETDLDTRGADPSRHLSKHPDQCTFFDGLQKAEIPYARLNPDFKAYTAKTCVVSETFALDPAIVSQYQSQYSTRAHQVGGLSVPDNESAELADSTLKEPKFVGIKYAKFTPDGTWTICDAAEDVGELRN